MNTNIVQNKTIRVAVISALLGITTLHTLEAKAEPIGVDKKTVKLKKIEDKYHKLKIGEKNIASAMSVVGKKEIENSSSAASIYSLLKLTPSVNEYQQNIGPGTPVLVVRGVRMSQLAQSVDGIPITSLLYGGQGKINSYNTGSPISTGQISGINVYPGVAPPDRSGFATVGGTINYKTKQPTKNRYIDFFAKVGSFSTDQYGIQANSGNIPGTGGLRVLLRLSKTNTSGYIEHTPATYRDFLFSAIKPYDYGLSKLSATVIYNTGSGYVFTSAFPVALQETNGLYYNFPLSQTSAYENNNYLTVMLGDKNYINRHLVVGAKVFYLNKNNGLRVHTDPTYIGAGFPYQDQFFVPAVTDGDIGGPGTPNNDFSYNPVSLFGSYAAGESAGVDLGSSQTFGIAPKINIFLPHNDVTIGGLIAQENGTGSSYVYGSLDMPEINGYNAYSYGEKSKRTIYSGYLQDKVNIFSNRLHIEPGVTLTGVSSSNFVPQNIFASPPYPYTLSNYDKEIQPYLGISYDIKKNIIAYASYGKGARFAPVSDYVLGINGSTTTAPGPETVNAYEAGIRYIGKKLYLNFDGYLQNMHGMFSFYKHFDGFSSYSNTGDEQMKGLEASAKYLIDKNWSIMGNVSYTKANYMNSYFAADTPSDIQFGYVLAGDPVPYVPNWLSNLSLDYHKHNFSGYLSTSYTGSEVTTYDTYLPQSYIQSGFYPDHPGFTFPDTSVRQKGYFLMNVGANYKISVNKFHLKWIKLSVNIDNLLNNHYYVHYSNVYKIIPKLTGITPPYYEGYPGMPRFIELGVSGRFT